MTFIPLLLLMLFNTALQCSITLDQVAETTTDNGTVNTLDWIKIGKSTYLVAGYDDGIFRQKIRTYQLRPCLSSVLRPLSSHIVYEGAVNSIESNVIAGKYYVAVAGDDGVINQELRVHSFIPGSGLSRRAVGSSFFNQGVIYGTKWTYALGGHFIAAVGNDRGYGIPVRVYQFNPATGKVGLTSAVASFDGTPYAADWLISGTEYYLAVAGSTSTAPYAATSLEIRIYQFDYSRDKKLTWVSAASLNYGSANCLKWVNKNGKHYLIVGGKHRSDGNYGSDETAQLRAYSFNPNTYALTLLDTYSLASATDENISCIDVTDFNAKTYVAAGSDNGIQQQLQLVQFDASLERFISTETILSSPGQIKTVRFIKDNNNFTYLAVGGNSGSSIGNIKVYALNKEEAPIISQSEEE